MEQDERITSFKESLLCAKCKRWNSCSANHKILNWNIVPQELIPSEKELRGSVQRQKVEVDETVRGEGDMNL